MKNIWIACLGLVMLWACESKPEESELMNTVRQSLDQENWEQAEEAASELLKHYPQSADGHNMLGYAHLQMGNVAKADSLFTQAHIRDSTNYKYLFNLGNTANILATQSGEPRAFLRAHVIYTDAIELKPDIPRLYINRAVMINNLSEFHEAIRDLKFAIKLDSTLPDAYYFLGRSYRNLANKDTIWVETQRVGITEAEHDAYRDSARVAFEGAVELAPNFGEALHWWGMLEMEDDNPAMACTLWERAKEAGSEHADANLHLNCPDYSDEHSEAEVDSIKAAIDSALEEGHFMGDGHGH